MNGEKSNNILLMILENFGEVSKFIKICLSKKVFLIEKPQMKTTLYTFIS